MHRIRHQEGEGEIKNIDDALRLKAGSHIDTIRGNSTVKVFKLLPLLMRVGRTPPNNAGQPSI